MDFPPNAPKEEWIKLKASKEDLRLYPDIIELHQLLQQQINEAEAKVNELRKKLDEERKTERAQAISAARDLIKTHGLTMAELGISGKTR